MKNILGILIMLVVLIACGEKQKTIKDYEHYLSKYFSIEFKPNNGEFSIYLPKDWYKNEDSFNSDTLLYILESGPKSLNDNGNHSIVIFKMNLSKGNINNEFDLLIDAYTKSASNIELIEKSKIRIGDIDVKSAHLKFVHNEEITQEEIDIFIPISNKEYYYIALVSDKNEHIESNFGMMLQIVKSFKLKK